MTIAEYKCAAFRRKEFLVVDKPAENAGFLLVFEFSSAWTGNSGTIFPVLSRFCTMNFALMQNYRLSILLSFCETTVFSAISRHFDHPFLRPYRMGAQTGDDTWRGQLFHRYAADPPDMPFG